MHFSESVGEKPYAVFFTDTGRYGDAMTTLDGYRVYARKTMKHRPRKNEEWYVNTLHIDEENKFIIVIPVRMVQPYEQYKNHLLQR